MLEDYQISEKLRYEDHYLKVGDRDVQIGGALGAALVCALLVDTDEGDSRGIAIDSEAEKLAWIIKYEREVRRNEWGLLRNEVELLSEAYIELASSEMELSDICPNIRLLDLALQLLTFYMHYLTRETFYNHIWECKTWKEPFAGWLLDAARIETRRQRFLKTDWTDAALVNALAERPNTTEEPTFFFEGESAHAIMKRYLKWLWTEYQAQLSEIPGSQPRAAKHRSYVVAQETDWTYLQGEIDALNDKEQQLWAKWMIDWNKYVTQQLKPEKPVLFWTQSVSEEQQEQLRAFLLIQEKEWDYYKCVSASIYALRQMGYVRRTCSVRDITRWMSEHLNNDYTRKNNHDQFVRAWKELGRYTEEVMYFRRLLEANGVTRIGEYGSVEKNQNLCK